MTVAALSAPQPAAARNPWLVAAVVVVPTFMEVLDTTIALVALRYIAGGLSATSDDGEWVITSYLAANAFILPITGWLSAHLGRRNYFLASIAIFTLASGLCGIAGSLGQLILFRVIQGLAGGGLQPSSQSVLLDAFPVEKQGMAMTLVRFRRPDRADRRSDPGRLDHRLLFVALDFSDQCAGRSPGVYRLLGAAARSGLSGRPAHRIAEAAVPFRLDRPVPARHRHGLLGGDAEQRSGMGLAGRSVLAHPDPGGSLYRGADWPGCFGNCGISNPVVNFRPLAERNFASCCIIIFCAYLALFAATKSLPGLLQSLFGYDALRTGLVMSPSGIFAVMAMPIVGRLIGLRMDARWLIGAGLLLMTAGNYWMSQLNLDISPGQAVWPRVVVVLGLSVCFAPANVAAYLYTPLALRGAAVGLLSLLRNEGGSVGMSLSQTFQERRDQFHTLRLGEYLDPLQRSRERLYRARPGVLPPSRSPTRSRRSSSACRRSKICCSNKHPRSPISTSFGCPPC